MAEELVDIYDAGKNLIAKGFPRETLKLKDGQYVLYALCIIQDASGKFLITKRANEKHWAAGWWEMPGGACRSGEDSLHGAIREAYEEAGIKADASQVRLLYSYRMDNPQDNDNYHVDIYHLPVEVREEDIVLDPAETCDWRLASWEDICALHEQGIFLHFERYEKALANAAL